MKKEQIDLLGDLFDAAGLTKSVAPPEGKLARLPEPEDATPRCARLDAERNEADRIAKRGYDFDVTAPSHNEYIGRTPAGTLIRTCLEHGVGLRVEADGTLVVASNGNAWRSLIDAIEAHVDEIAVLILSGWSPYDA